jgi:CheY-like chemotaxis protein
MRVLQDRNLEALIFSDDRRVSARCAEAFAELPVDWVKTEDPAMAQQLLGNSNFDFVLLDLDAPSGTALLPRVRPDSADRQHAVVLGITSGGIDADILEMSYESLIFYPVRPDQICSEVHRALPLAERIAVRTKTPASSSELLEGEAKSFAIPEFFRSIAHKFRAFNLSKVIAWGTHHSLSIVAQERAASLISAAGTIWYVHEVTRDWTRLAFLVPAVGPSELIGVAVLLWLCAKHRRFAEKSAMIPASAKSER